MKNRELCGWLISGDINRPCAWSAGHTTSHRDLTYIEARASDKRKHYFSNRRNGSPYTLCELCGRRLNGSAPYQVCGIGSCKSTYNHRRHLRIDYNKSWLWYEEQLKVQNYKCAVCRKPEKGTGRVDKFHVDHDHSCCAGITSCGRCVRGLLCNSCNFLLGLADDSAVILYTAIAYLNLHKNIQKGAVGA